MSVENLEKEKTEESKEVENPVKEKTNWKATALEVQKRASEIEAKYQEAVGRLQEVEENQLASQNNFKQLFENEKKKREFAEVESKKIKDSYVNGLKMSAVKEHAIKMGIQDPALNDLDLLDKSMVQAEFTSTGRVNVLGAQEFVENLKNERPYWFRQTSDVVINNQASNAVVNKSEMAPLDILKLQRENPSAYREYMSQKLAKK